jgi:hypothetical protein
MRGGLRPEKGGEAGRFTRHSHPAPFDLPPAFMISLTSCTPSTRSKCCFSSPRLDPGPANARLPTKTLNPVSAAVPLLSPLRCAWPLSHSHHDNVQEKVCWWRAVPGAGATCLPRAILRCITRTTLTLGCRHRLTRRCRLSIVRTRLSRGGSRRRWRR